MHTDEQKKENEKKKEFLWSYRKAKWRMSRLQDELREYRLSKYCPSSGGNDGMPHGSGMSDLSLYALKVDDYEKKIMRASKEATKRMRVITTRIEALEDEREKAVLYYRYIEGKTWEQVMQIIGYEWTHMHRLHARALRNLKI